MLVATSLFLKRISSTHAVPTGQPAGAHLPVLALDLHEHVVLRVLQLQVAELHEQVDSTRADRRYYTSL